MGTLSYSLLLGRLYRIELQGALSQNTVFLQHEAAFVQLRQRLPPYADRF